MLVASKHRLGREWANADLDRAWTGPGLGVDWTWTGLDGPGHGLDLDLTVLDSNGPDLDRAWTGPGLDVDWAWTGPVPGLDAHKYDLGVENFVLQRYSGAHFKSLLSTLLKLSQTQ